MTNILRTTLCHHRITLSKWKTRGCQSTHHEVALTYLNYDFDIVSFYQIYYLLQNTGKSHITHVSHICHGFIRFDHRPCAPDISRPLSSHVFWGNRSWYVRGFHILLHHITPGKLTPFISRHALINLFWGSMFLKYACKRSIHPAYQQAR